MNAGIIDYLELFTLVEASDGLVIVNHAITGERAGTILRTSQGLALRSDEGRFIGTFPKIDTALRNLYALV